MQALFGPGLPHLETLKPKTLNPKPTTPNPKPQTQNPELQTPNPKPQTLNPKFETRNSKPETLKLNPETPGMDMAMAAFRDPKDLFNAHHAWDPMRTVRPNRDSWSTFRLGR
jgi:hypothetical protein